MVWWGGHTGGDWAAQRPVLILVVLMGLVLLLAESLRSLTSWVRIAQAELVQDHIHSLIHKQAMALDLAFMNFQTITINYLRRVDAINRPVALLENIGTLVQNGITLVGMAAVLLSYGLWLPLLLFAGTIPALFVVLRHTFRFHNWRVRNTAAVRRTRYYDWMLTLREAAAEMRLFNLGDHFSEAFQSLRQRLRTERVSLARDEALAQLSASFFGFLSLAVAVVWIMRQAMLGLVSLGDVALLYQAFYQGQQMMRSLLTNTGEIYRNVRFLENLFEFLALEPQLKTPEHPQQQVPTLRKEIKLEGVSFHYPDSQRLA